MKFTLKNVVRQILSVLAIAWLSFATPVTLTATSHTYAQSSIPDTLIKDTKSNSSRKNFDPKDTTRAVTYMTTNEKKLAPLAKPTSGPTPTPVANSYYVQPILFIPQDMQESAGNTQAINDTFQMLKRWYSGSLEQNNSGYIFALKNTVVYKAPQPLSYYKCPNHETSCDTYDGIWGNVQTELMNAGFPLWATGTSHVILVKGAEGWAGSNAIFPNGVSNWPAPGPASSAGVSILGDWALDGISGTVNQNCFASIGTACYLDPQRGAIGHELGHTFGLAHAMDQQGSIMSNWWSFPNISLISAVGNDEKSVLRTDSSFFTSTPCTKDALVTQVTQPANIKVTTVFQSQFQVINYGYCHWSPSSTAIQIVKDDVWGLRQQFVTSDVYPAQSYTFVLNLKSPNLPTNKLPITKQSIWQMQDSSKFFGPQMGGPITITR